MRKRKRSKNILELRNGRWFENGKRLSSTDYIFSSTSEEGSYIRSCVTDQLYRLRGSDGRVVC